MEAAMVSDFRQYALQTGAVQVLLVSGGP